MCCSEIVVYLGLETFRKIIQCCSSRSQPPEKKSLVKPGAAVEDDDCSRLYFNIISNPTFTDGTQDWFGLGCSLALGNYCGSSFCVAQNRQEGWQGLAQDITKRLESDVDYKLEAWVGIAGKDEQSQVQAILKVEESSGGIQYIRLKSVTVRKGKWSLLASEFRINQCPKKAIVCIEGPSGGTDILVSSVDIIPSSTSNAQVVDMKSDDDARQAFDQENEASRAAYGQAGLVQNPGNKIRDIVTPMDTITPPPGMDDDPGYYVPPGIDDDPDYYVNILDNSNLYDGTHDWFSMGNCRLSVGAGGPKFLGSSAEESFVDAKPPILSGKYLYVSRRTESFEGPAQDITGSIQLFTTYQVTAWVATCLPKGTRGLATPQKVNVALDVDGEWMQGGEVTADGKWTELSGSFRFETDFKQVICYIQGPEPGVDLKVAGLHIFAVDRLARVPLLQKQVEKVRKRDVVVRLRDSDGRLLPPGTRVSIKQTKNSFPIGSAINYQNLTQDKAYRKFFLDNFNWAVFENELKWSETEKERGQVRYEEADEMVKFCNDNGIPMRGHCILWEEEEYVQDWVRNLEREDLIEAVQARFDGLLSRFQGQFKHYDVDNEMLHGSFFRDRLGSQFLSYLFKLAEHFDSEASLFVNDYHVVDGWDCDSLPTKYAELVDFLQTGGAKIGGIGVQGHVEVPVGPIISQGLDILSKSGIPIWFTEIDVSSVNETVRADDLEVVLREAFAHPSVEGCLLWGFMEGAMARENAALVDSGGSLTQAGRRFLALREEWMTNCEAVVDDKGELAFRGFHGDYTLSTPEMGVSKTFEVSKGNGVLAVDI